MPLSILEPRLCHKKSGNNLKMEKLFPKLATHPSLLYQKVRTFAYCNNLPLESQRYVTTLFQVHKDKEMLFLITLERAKCP